MNFEQQIILEDSQQCYNQYLPHISVDTVIFGFANGNLKVLLLKMKFNKQWFLPGGYMYKEENLIVAAKRILKERAGVDNIFLKEFGVFGNHDRYKDAFKDLQDGIWFKQRFVSIGYYALVNYDIVIPKMDKFSEACEWIDLDNLSDLPIAMDHKKIIEKALYTLRTEISYQPIGYNLLPKKFTLPELQKLYESILDRSLNRGNFYRKIKNLGILKKLNEQRRGGNHKAPDLYSFDEENYHKALENGLNNW
ncbi:NUDIX hydrolase [Elizabethkingia anophelis]|uniref:NUDIX hydrolase n=1 Tax=Elizabethkingia anophelis TaxID=1117645 RepID=A0AAE4T354_9FLAO|nr:NUDIX hydrolase [Elizabethkingia anophelis]MCT3918523.1 NUDIX hydrolase [Elizabethkingia anophelis]MCT3950877.1 NUDIX hydrolase [Elizabethkingia anophelis]MCT3954420.1 NUDIX hydrolase [Elizabethkingia anophelis]MCT3975609.1 NUDIX hydrolase [Elizabethkingia anophelis]